MTNASDFWDQSLMEDTLPPFDARTLTACERRMGVRLPPALIDLLRGQNGGYIRHGEFTLAGETHEIEKIHGIARTVKDNAVCTLAEWLATAQQSGDYEHVAIPNPDKLVKFGSISYAFVALDYRACGATGVPSVCYFAYADGGGGVQTVAADIAEFLSANDRGSEHPAIDWDVSPGKLLQEDVVDAISSAGIRWQSVSRCYRDGATVIVRTRARIGGIPEVITEGRVRADRIEIEANMMHVHAACRPAVSGIMVQAADGNDVCGISTVTCEDDGGRWKNRRDDQVYVTYDSHDRQRLAALIRTLTGKLPSANFLRTQTQADEIAEAMHDRQPMKTLQRAMGEVDTAFDDLDAGDRDEDDSRPRAKSPGTRKKSGTNKKKPKAS